MKLRGFTIVADAVERACEHSFVLAVNRWFKHRDRGEGLPVNDPLFQAHVAEVFESAVMEALDGVLDFDAEQGQEVAPATDRDQFVLDVYRGGGGWRWALRRLGKTEVLGTSPYFRSYAEVMREALSIADGTGLQVHVAIEETGTSS